MKILLRKMELMHTFFQIPFISFTGSTVQKHQYSIDGINSMLFAHPIQKVNLMHNNLICFVVFFFFEFEIYLLSVESE